MKTLLVTLASVALLLASCVPTMQVDSLLKQVQDNQIAALDAYDGKRIRVTGTVEATGLKSYNETVTEGTVGGANVGDVFVGSSESTSRTQTKQSPFVSLKADGSIAGNVVCFFSDDDRGEAAKVRVGETITLMGEVFRVKGSSKFALVQMGNCYIAR